MIKRNKTLLVAVVLLVTCAMAELLYPRGAGAAWPTTSATRCWSIDSGTFMKARIIPAGGGFYTVHSIIVMNGSIHNVGTGTAYVQGNSVHLVGSDAGKGPDAMWTSQGYTVLNKTTLVGTTEGIGHDKNYGDGSLDTEYSGGAITLTPISCTAIWQ